MRRNILYFTFLLLGSFSRAQDADTNAPETPDIPFHITTSSDNDRVVVGGGSVHVKRDEVVHDVVVVGGSALIEGKVTGDCTVVFGTLKLTSTAEIKKDLTVVMGMLEADPNAKLGRKPTIVGANSMEMPAALRWVPQWFSKGLMLGRPLPHQFAWAWIVCGIFIVLYLLLALLFRGPIGACVHVLETRPGSSLLTGLLALLLFGPLLLLLLITVIGAVLIPFLFCAAIAAYFFGKVVVYAYAGQQIVGNRMAPLLPVLVGAILFSLLYTIPVVGFLVWGVAAPLGLGAVLLAFFARLRKEDPKPPLPTAPVPPPPAAATPPGAAPAYSMTAVSPRAGFWLRFLGTVIDAALIFVICRVFHVRGPLPIAIWTVYHIAMWTFKGATLGGLVVGTRIVRTDGSPVDFSVAVVRALASYLSAAAFMLGFFWAGWSAQKQSWHDIIAGTYVVKTRPVLQPAPLPAPASQ